METDPPPGDDADITRRELLKLTGIATVGAVSTAGCLGRSDIEVAELGYGGVPWRASSAVPPGLTGANPLSVVGPSDGLVGHWPLDGSGGTVADVAGGNDGVVRGNPELGVPGVHGSTAVAFGPTADDYVEVAPASVLAPAELSFAGWYRTTSGGAEQTVLQKADARYGDEGYAVDVQTPNSLRAHVGVESGRATVNPFGVATHDGAWHHVCCTWDGEAFVLYLDGEERDRDTAQSGAVVHSDRPLYVGYGDNGYASTYAMNGAVDDARVYDRALGSDEVAALYEGVGTQTETETPTVTDTPTPTPTPTPTETPTPIPTPTPTPTETPSSTPTPTPTSPSSQPAPVARWQFTETGGTTVADSAGSNDGFVRGSPTLAADGVFDTSGIAFGPTADDYVEVPDAGTLRPATALSFGGWYRTTSGGTEQTVLQKADARFGDEGYAVDVQSPSRIRAHLAVESGRATVNPSVDTHDGAWHHVCCTWDGEAFVLYLDGEERDRDISQAGEIVHSTRSLYVGYGDNGYTTVYDLDGSVDDVRVYDTALTAAQVAAVVDGAGTDGETPSDTPTATPIPNDEFGESGYGSHGYGGIVAGSN
ncbi:LamG domain-containing protein [Haloarcula brevis]|uniref:LamG domain-containing protein n=1 Tax=Haloarcula brevis TaxID=3111453 RepID=UPI00300EDD63